MLHDDILFIYNVLILYMYYTSRKRYVDIFTSKYYLTKHVTHQNKLNCATDDYKEDETIYKPWL